MKKNQEENFDINSIKFDAIEHHNNMQFFNEEWKVYWYEAFKNKYSEHELVKEIAKLEELVRLYRTEITKLANTNDILFYENTSLGEQLEVAKADTILKVDQIKQLQELTKPVTGLFSTANIIMKQRKEKRKLENENYALRNQRLQITTAPPTTSTMQQIDDSVVEKILTLHVEGNNYNKIAEVTGVSKASVSRYINKHKKRITFMQQGGLG